MGRIDWRRRQALQIASQLPEDPKDALAVLDHAKTLVERFLGECEPNQEAPRLRLASAKRLRIAPVSPLSDP